MKQVSQQLMNGKVRVREVAAPGLSSHEVMVRLHYSVISAGTEGHTVATGQKSLIGKALERPAQVKQVLETLREQGVVQTHRAVTKRLEAYGPLGYSGAGEVLAVGGAVTSFRVGDRVACAGAGYANHAEVVCVPETQIGRAHV